MNIRRHYLGIAAASIGICLPIAQGSAQTPEQQQLWDAQRGQAQADAKLKADMLSRQRAARRADPMAWVRTLNPMPNGGWEFRAVAPDGSWAAFSTDHQEKRSGRMVTLWLRQEYPEPQRSGGGGDVYLSSVEKVQFDCGNDRQRVLLAIYYAENNIGGSQQQEESDPKHAPWDAVVPGTQSDSVFQWACSKARPQ